MAKDPLRNFRYQIEIDNIRQAGFSDCTGGGGTIETIEYREGGEPGYPRKLTGQVKYANITLKWGIIDDRTLVDWFQDVADGKIIRKNGSIVLLDTTGKEQARWNFYNALPAKYDPPDLSGKGNDVAIDMIELSVERFERARR